MSRQMAFWKYENGIYLDNHKVYEDVCCNENSADGLSKLPIESILRRIGEEFSDYNRLDDLNYEGYIGSFTVETTEQSVLFDCSWDMPYPESNRIIDIMLEFDCPFYDPQIDTRFDGRK